MYNKKAYFIETVIYQILWIIISLILLYIFYEVLGSFLINRTDTEIQFNTLYNFYINLGRYLFLLFSFIIVLTGAFWIQNKRFNKYNQYFSSGVKYLNGEITELIPFHESLSDERESFIKFRNKYIQVEKEYETAYKEKTDLLTYLAHDIKTPLAIMIGYSTLLNDEESLTEEQRKKFTKIIYENVKYLNRLSEDFFSYLKFNLNDIPINIMQVNAEVFFRQWKEERNLTTKEHNLILKFSEIERYEIKTDPQLLLRIMDNLLTNAVNYSNKGSIISIDVSIINGYLKFSITNFVEKDLNVDWEMVTSKFYSGDISRRIMKNKGSGLGLTIVNDIVKHLGGEFEISKIDDKVCAKVSLPCRI